MKLNLRSSSHEGFVFTIPLMLAIGLIIFTAIIVLTQIVVAVGGPLIPQLVTEMPRFFDYDDVTGDLILDGDGNPASNERTELYFGLFVFSFIILIVIGILSVLVLLLEQIKWVNPGTAWRLLRKVILFIPFFAVFPFLWDLWAITIESTAMALIDFNSGGVDAATRTANLWNSMGGIIPPGAFDPAEWTNAFVDPGAFAQGIMKDVILALFKGFAVMFMTAMAFIISTIRIMLTMVFAMSIPLILVLGLIPLFRKLKDLVVNNLVGLSLAPIFSALILTTGMAYLDSTVLPGMQDWFASLAVGFLAVFAPVILAPILGTLTTQVGQMMSTAIMGAAIIGGTAGQGALTGMSNASNQMSNAAMGMAGAAGAMGASKMGALGGGNGGGLTSGQIGTFTSGAATSMSSGGTGNQPMAFGGSPQPQQSGLAGNNPIQQTPLSFGEKFKAYGKAGLFGAGSGMAAGAVQSAGHMMHADKIVRPIVNDIQGVGTQKGIEIGQHTTANHSVNDIGNSMTAMEPQINIQTETAVMPDNIPNATQVSDFGGALNNVENVSRGVDLSNSSEQQQEFLDVARSNVRNFENLKPEIQNQVDQRILEQMREHPASAGQIVDAARMRGENQNIF
ncbi:hypothetical protein [Nitrosopumilus sp.]|uniref:hypothetical protein n=1 Tax=Nitrosopumilus sp. TaxID=2024843 RepID=UPI003B5A7EF6